MEYYINLKICFVAILVVGFGKSDFLPLKRKCSLKDSACMMEAFQESVASFMEGVPELGIEVLDVLELDDIKFDISGLKFSLTDGRIKGLKNSVIDNVKWNLSDKRIEVDYHGDLTVKGHYTANGRILILPITGDGQMKIKLKNNAVKLYLYYNMEKKKDGKDYIMLKKYDVDFEVKDNASFNLTNLFNGNQELADTMLTFLSDNWKQISSEFGRPLIDTAAKKMYKNIILFFDKVPISDIAVI